MSIRNGFWNRASLRFVAGRSMRGALAIALACGSAATVRAQVAGPGVRSAAGTDRVIGQPGTVKVKFPTGVATPEYLRATGGVLVADYGSFSVAQFPAGSVPAVENAEVMPDENIILLNAVKLDTTTPAVKQLQQARGEFAGRSLHMVQYAGPIQPAWYDKLSKTGVQIVTYIPSNTYLVYGTAAQLAAVEALAAQSPEIQWNGAYADAYKIDPATLAVMQGAQGSAEIANAAKLFAAADPLFVVQFVHDPAANKDSQAVIDAIRSGPVYNTYDIGDYHNVTAPIPANLVGMIAAQPEVISIMPYIVPQLFDERQNQIIAGNLSGNLPSGPGYLAWLGTKGFTQAQFTASNFLVDVTDSGIDNGTTSPNHFGLYVSGTRPGTSRISYNRLVGTANAGSTIQGCDGHGNLNTHIVAGYSNLTGFPYADASGYRYGLGVCPFVKAGSSVIFDPNTFTSPNYTTLQSRASNDGARISTNSWGANVAGAYNTDSQSYDFLVRDAQPTGSTFPLAGNQEMVIVFSAGNAGSGASTVGSPGTAKNVITVGATEGVQAFGGSDGCATTDAQANSANDMATFSSRGPCVDQRKKPDIVAPGTHISGGVAQTASPAATGTANACFNGTGVCGGVGSNFFPAGQQFYSASSGTSHSCPAVAGGAALIRQFFINQGMAVPSAAMTKAMLMNSARYLTGTGANDTLPSNSQGMGDMNLGEAFNRGAVTPTIFRDQVAADTFTASGQTRVFSGSIVDNTKPFRITLAWTDAPGTTSASAFKNNLDLTVVIGANTYRGNVFTGANSTTGGAADTRNNVESVFLPAGTTGSFTVTVTATSINSDGVPNSGGALDQDFGLVIYNGSTGCVAAGVTTNPTAQTVCAGTSTSFTVVGSGTAPLTYQWRKGAANIAGATAATYTIASPVAGDSGSYDCVITNSCGNATSTAAALVVQAGTPTITTNPVSQSACTGSTVNFTVAATSTAPATFQWRKGGSNISGATSPTLALTGIAGSAAGSYDCVVSNVCGLSMSTAATLTVNVPPTIVTSPATQTTCAGSSVTFSVSAVGSPSPTLQWRKNTVNIPGATGGTFTINPVSAGDAGSYDCVATNVCNSATTSSATLTVNTGPTITTNPSTQTVCSGTSVSFVAAASGTPTPTLQWRKNTVNIPGATGPTFTITSAGTGDAGLYDCVATNSCSTATTSAASLTVNTAPSIGTNPISQTVCANGSASFTVSATGSPSPTFQWRKNSVNIPGATADTLSIPAVLAGDAGSYDCVVTNSCGNATSSAATLSVNSAPSIGSNPTSQAVCSGSSVTFTASASGSPTPTFQWRKNTVDIPGQTGPSLTITTVAVGDAGSYDCVTTNSCGSATTTAATLTVNGLPSISANPSSAEVCKGNLATFSVTAGGTPAPTYQWRFNTVDIPGATSDTLSFTALSSSGGLYDCVVTNSCGSVTSTAGTLTVDFVPGISLNPSSTSGCVGGTASFTVAASGIPAPTFQWRKNGSNILGATSSTLNLPGLVAGDAGSYDCVVTNSCGSVPSSSADLVVNSSPSVSTDPSPQLVCEGGSASFSVIGSGSPAPTYQWRKDGVPIPGATAATFAITFATVPDAGSYDCVLSNSCGDATSGGASLIVNTLPVVTIDPASVSVSEGSPATFTVVATGTGPLSYQWRKDTVDIGGATADTYSIPATAAGDAGTYDCVVTNSCGSATSGGAVLTIGTGCPCVADFDQSGGAPDAGDVDAFFIAWLAGEPSADADCSGGAPDASDVDLFFVQWLAGGC